MEEFRKHKVYSNSNMGFNMMEGIEHYYSEIGSNFVLYQLKFNYKRFAICLLKEIK